MICTDEILSYKVTERRCLFCLNPDHRPAPLRVYHRKFTVRRKSIYRRLFLRQIIRQIFKSRLLVASKEDPDPVLRFIPQFLQCIQTVQAGKHRSFIIQNSPAIQYPLFCISCKRRLLPSVSGRHHIHMADGTYIIFAPAILHITDVIVQIYCPKAQFFAHFQRP